jgi:lysyl-tRNA synthetase class 2
LFSDPRQPDVGPTYWLQTSPEFCLKRLIASVAEQAEPLAIYQLAKAFRGGESGRLHNPEFTLVEWYRVGDDYEAGMQFLGELAAEMLGRGQPERITWREAFLRYAKLDPQTATIEELLDAAKIVVGPGEEDVVHRHWLLDTVLIRCVEPHLGKSSPTILYDYPADQAALARVRPAASENEPAVAERFELYVDGIELANGYHELLDPAVLRARNDAQNAARLSDGKYPLPSDSRLLAAMDHGLPPCSGCALGFDRLAMIALGKRSIAEVLAFPADRA